MNIAALLDIIIVLSTKFAYLATAILKEPRTPNVMVRESALAILEMLENFVIHA